MNIYLFKKDYFWNWKKEYLNSIFYIEDSSLFKRDNKIRIGIYTYNLKNGGIQRISSLLLDYLYKIKIFKLYLFSQKEKENNEYLIPNCIKRIFIGKSKFKSLLKEIKKNKINILIYQFPNEYCINYLNRLKKIKIVFYQHYSFFYWMYYDYSKFKELYKSYQNSKYIVSLVPLENDYVFKKWGIGSILMSNFVTYEQKKIIPSDLTENIILMIGRSNDNYKRLYLGIQTMEYITKEITRCKMIIISNVTNNYYLKNLVNDLILTKSVIFKGYSSIPEVYYKNISLHIFPTISESFGLVLSETKIYGIPNILIGLDYVSISKGGTIIIYDDKSETISKIIIEILNNENYKKLLSKEARINMSKINNEELLKKWTELLLSIFNGKKYYNNLRKKGNMIKEKDALICLSNQINLFKKRKKKYYNFTLNNFLDFFVKI